MGGEGIKTGYVAICMFPSRFGDAICILTIISGVCGPNSAVYELKFWYNCTRICRAHHITV